MNEQLTAVDAAIDRLAGQASDLLAELVAVPSVNPRQPGVVADEMVGGELAANKILASRLSDLGMSINWVAIQEGRPNLVATIGGAGHGRSLAINAHIDTVSAGEVSAWRDPGPWQLTEADGFLYGLGASDTKSGHAIAWLAVAALQDAGITLAGELQVHSVVGEETMSHEIGTSAVIEAGYRTDAAIVIEPTSTPENPLMVANAAAGNYLFDVTVRGKSTHWASRGRAIHAGGEGDAVGVNAIDKAFIVYRALRDLEERWGITKQHAQFLDGTFIIHPGVLHADVGVPAAPYFPDRARFAYLLSFPPGETAEDIRDEVTEHVVRATSSDPWLRANPVEFDWLDSWPPAHTPAEHPLTQAVLAARNDIVLASAAGTVQSHPVANSAQSDASFYELAGIPAVVFGPGDRTTAHGSDDRVEAALLASAARVLARAVVSWCNA